MSINRVLTCDECGRMEKLTVRDFDQVSAEGTMPGWIRLSVNNPYRFSSMRYEEERYEVNEWVDLCSVSCSTSRLYGYQRSE